MVAKRTIDQQLRSLKLRFLVFGRAEVKELRRILQPTETIQHCVYGFYQGGSAILVATTDRLLLIDKRPFFVNLEDIRYELIKDVDYAQRLLQGTLFIHAGMKRLMFRSLSDARLKRLKTFIDEQKSDTDVHIVQAFGVAKNAVKPYLNPAWRPHHTTFIRRRPAKFYSQSRQQPPTPLPTE